MKKEMAGGRNDEAIAKSLQEMAQVMAQENTALQANQNNKNGGSN